MAGETHLRLAVIPEPEEGTRTVLAYQGEGTIAIQGSTKPNLVMDCGACGVPLVAGVGVNQIINIVFRCKGCGAFNEALN